jgi:hypothetical protein
MLLRFLRAAMLALAFLVPEAAMAQTAPSYAMSQAASTSDDDQIRGRVVAFDGRYDLTVRDERGYTDNVELHEGTIINPTGLTLAPGMIVSVLGYNAGSYYSANEIDTPYTFYGGDPYFLGHPWNYYGPSVSFGFFFGHTGWWHGAAFHGSFHYTGGARVYSNVHVRNIYNHGVAHNGGAFHGRSFVAPHAHGGYHAAMSGHGGHMDGGHMGGGHMGGGHAGGGHMGGGHAGGGHGGGHH